MGLPAGGGFEAAAGGFASTGAFASTTSAGVTLGSAAPRRRGRDLVDRHLRQRHSPWRSARSCPRAWAVMRGSALPVAVGAILSGETRGSADPVAVGEILGNALPVAVGAILSAGFGGAVLPTDTLGSAAPVAAGAILSTDTLGSALPVAVGAILSTDTLGSALPVAVAAILSGPGASPFIESCGATGRTPVPAVGATSAGFGVGAGLAAVAGGLGESPRPCCVPASGWASWPS